MIATIFNYLGKGVEKAANYFLPKEGEKVGLKTHVVAIAAIAVTANFNPLLAAQLGANYGLFTYISNHVKKETIIDERSLLEERSLLQDEREVDFKNSDLGHLSNLDLTEHEKLLIAADYVYQ